MLLLLLFYRVRYRIVALLALLLLLKCGGVEHGFRANFILNRAAALKGANTTVPA